jgi:hypothetical protein
MHRQVHRTDVVPELAGSQSTSLVARSKKRMSLVARSKKVWTSELYVSNFTSSQGKQTSSCGRGVVETVPEHSVRRGRRVPKHSRRVIDEYPSLLCSVV